MFFTTLNNLVKVATIPNQHATEGNNAISVDNNHTSFTCPRCNHSHYINDASINESLILSPVTQNSSYKQSIPNINLAQYLKGNERDYFNSHTGLIQPIYLTPNPNLIPPNQSPILLETPPVIISSRSNLPISNLTPPDQSPIVLETPPVIISSRSNLPISNLTPPDQSPIVLETPPAFVPLQNEPPIPIVQVVELPLPVTKKKPQAIKEKQPSKIISGKDDSTVVTKEKDTSSTVKSKTQITKKGKNNVKNTCKFAPAIITLSVLVTYIFI